MNDMKYPKIVTLIQLRDEKYQNQTEDHPNNYNVVDPPQKHVVK